MTRVLLFTQTGDGRPKCVSRSVGYDPAEILAGQKWLADSGFYLWWTAHATAMAADRWWLVECENAEHGRLIIMDRVARMVDRSGRVLASGGKP